MTTSHATALKPARAKAHSPYATMSAASQATDPFTFKVVTVAGGEKGTGVQLSRYGYFLNRTTKELQSRSRIPLATATIRQRLEDIAIARGYTIVHWPEELRP